MRLHGSETDDSACIARIGCAVHATVRAGYNPVLRCTVHVAHLRATGEEEEEKKIVQCPGPLEGVGSRVHANSGSRRVRWLSRR